MPVVTARGLASVAAIPLLIMGLAGCGSGGPGSAEDELSPEQIVLASYEGLEGESYRMKTALTINGLDVMNVTSTVEGEAAHSSQNLYLSTLLQVVGDGLDVDPEMAAMMEAMFTDMQTETILADGVVYLQVSGGMFDLSERLGEDAWFTIDLSAVSDIDAIYERIGTFDLASQTKTLLYEITDVEQTGDGVYTGTLSEDSELLQSMLGPVGAAGAVGAAQAILDTAEVVVTVDSAGLLKTIELTIADVEGLTLRMFSEVIEVGGAYGIGAPDSDNIHSFEELIGAMAR